MAKAQILKVEQPLSTAQVTAQLRRYGAHLRADKSTETRRIFYSGSTRLWIQLLSLGYGDAYALEYYASCPC